MFHSPSVRHIYQTLYTTNVILENISFASLRKFQVNKNGAASEVKPSHCACKQLHFPGEQVTQEMRHFTLSRTTFIKEKQQPEEVEARTLSVFPRARQDSVYINWNYHGNKIEEIKCSSEVFRHVKDMQLIVSCW